MTQSNKFFDAAHVSQALAQNLRKVDLFADTMLGQLDNMIDAAHHGRWDSVARTGELLALTSRAAGFRGVSALADAVKEQAGKPNNEVEIKRSLIRLIGMCGRSGAVESARADVRESVSNLG